MFKWFSTIFSLGAPENIPVRNYEYVFSVRACVRALTPLQQFQIIMGDILRRLTLLLSTQQWWKQNGVPRIQAFSKALGCCHSNSFFFWGIIMPLWLLIPTGGLLANKGGFVKSYIALYSFVFLLNLLIFYQFFDIYHYYHSCHTGDLRHSEH